MRTQQNGLGKLLIVLVQFNLETIKTVVLLQSVMIRDIDCKRAVIK